MDTFKKLIVSTLLRANFTNAKCGSAIIYGLRLAFSNSNQYKSKEDVVIHSYCKTKERKKRN